MTRERPSNSLVRSLGIAAMVVLVSLVLYVGSSGPMIAYVSVNQPCVITFYRPLLNVASELMTRYVNWWDGSTKIQPMAKRAVYDLPLE